jgi:hypothetical protein
VGGNNLFYGQHKKSPIVRVKTTICSVTQSCDLFMLQCSMA